MNSINSALGEDAHDEYRRIFNQWWPTLEEKLSDLPKDTSGKEEERKTNDELLREILTNTREQLRLENLRSKHSENMDEIKDRIGKDLLGHIASMSSEKNEDESSEQTSQLMVDISQAIGTKPDLVKNTLSALGETYNASIEYEKERNKPNDPPKEGGS